MGVANGGIQIQELGLVDSVRITRRTEPGAKNRFIYYPDQLNRLPADRPSFSDFLSLWKTGILGGAARMLIEPFVPQRPSSMTDETVGSFLSRRVDKRIADNLVSAVFHGIYAGDIWQLSARTLLSLPWQLEKRYSSALGGFFRMQSEDERSEQVTLIHPHDLAATKAMNEEIEIDHEFVAALKDAAMFTFKDGLQELVRAMQGAVEDMGNVEIKTEAPVQSYKATEGKQGVEVISGVSFSLSFSPYYFSHGLFFSNQIHSHRENQQPTPSTSPSLPSPPKI
jgi:oxygen-dependent protoporphyrinogen oxidase